MSKEFEKWFNDSSYAYDSYKDYELAEAGWDECKERVLEILKSHEDNDGFSKDVLIDKIEKL